MDVTLDKGDDGLGITVAGYVSPDSTNNGKRFYYNRLIIKEKEKKSRFNQIQFKRLFEL